VISLSQRPLRDYTQYSQQRTTHPARFEPVISAGEGPQTLIKIARNKLSIGAYPLANFSFTVAERPQRADNHYVHLLFSAAEC